MVFLEINQIYAKMGQELISNYLSVNKTILLIIHNIFDNAFYALLYLAIILSGIFIIMSITVLFSRKRITHYHFDEKQAPFVTIQIPTYNELAAINCAKNCLKIDYPKNKYEIIIGDDSNNPQISQQITDFAGQHPELIKVTRRGNNIGFKPGNLNHMLQYSRGEIITILDSDFLPEQDYLKKMVAPFQQSKNTGAVQVRWKFINQNQNLITILGAVIGLTFHHIYLPFMKKLGGISFLCGSAEAVRKNLIIQLGGWQNGSLTEDIEFSLRLLKNNYDITYLEDHECACEVPYIAKDLYRQQMRWAFGVISAFVQHSKAIIFNKNLTIQKKASIYLQSVGYFFSMLLVMLFITGTISFISNTPAQINITKFLTEMTVNIVLTSGILILSIIAILKTKNARILPKVLTASFTYGLIVTYYVNIGIFKAILGKEMHWFMLNKNGNKTVNS